MKTEEPIASTFEAEVFLRLVKLEEKLAKVLENQEEILEQLNNINAR